MRHAHEPAPPAHRPRRHTAALVLAGALFVAIFALRLAVDDPEEPVLFLLALPIALAAFELGSVGGLAAGALGLAFLLAWSQGGDHDLGTFDYAVRALTFLVVGGSIGLMSERLRTAVEALQRTNESLRNSNRDLEQFAYMAAHDLQSPLSVVGGFTSLVRERYRDRLDADAARHLDYMAAGVADMQELIDGMLRFARGGAAALDVEEVDTRALVEDVVADLRQELESRQVELSVGELPVLQADAQRLRQVFVNLLSNALKFSDDPARVEVRARREAHGWTFEVADTGIGVAPEDAERIFEPLQRADSERRGAGIGLAVCRRIVEAHGGEIGVRPGPERGSVFAFTLPDALPGA